MRKYVRCARTFYYFFILVVFIATFKFLIIFVLVYYNLSFLFLSGPYTAFFILSMFLWVTCKNLLLCLGTHIVYYLLFFSLFFIHCYLETLQHLGHIAPRIFGCIPEGCVFLLLCIVNVSIVKVY